MTDQQDFNRLPTRSEVDELRYQRLKQRDLTKFYKDIWSLARGEKTCVMLRICADDIVYQVETDDPQTALVDPIPVCDRCDVTCFTQKLSHIGMSVKRRANDKNIFYVTLRDRDDC